MDFLLMYLVPPLLGIGIGTGWFLACRARSRIAAAELLADRTAELRRANEQLREANNRLAEEAITDPLTGVLNRRFLTAHLEREAARILRLHENKATSTPGNILLVVDIDDFKDFNDRNGHVLGDQALLRFSDILKQAVRSSDYVVRWGGEEFVLLATDARPEDGAIIANRILESVREHKMIGACGQDISLTCSIGVSHFPFFPDHARALHWQQVLQVADLCAYLAKHSGKDAWYSLRGRRYDADFRFEHLLEEMAGAPDDLYLDEALVVGRSIAVFEEPVADCAI